MRRQGVESTSTFLEGNEGAPGSQQCGLLRKSLYRTDDAAQNWECELGGFLEVFGLRRGTSERVLTLRRGGESALRSMVLTSLSWTPRKAADWLIQSSRWRSRTFFGWKQTRAT